MLKNFEVEFKIYENLAHTASSTGSDIRTMMQAQNRWQIEAMINATYNGFAKIWTIREVK